jgi:hypothetical protein
MCTRWGMPPWHWDKMVHFFLQMLFPPLSTLFPIINILLIRLVLHATTTCPNRHHHMPSPSCIELVANASAWQHAFMDVRRHDCRCRSLQHVFGMRFGHCACCMACNMDLFLRAHLLGRRDGATKQRVNSSECILSRGAPAKVVDRRGCRNFGAIGRVADSHRGTLTEPPNQAQSTAHEVSFNRSTPTHVTLCSCEAHQPLKAEGVITLRATGGPVRYPLPQLPTRTN